MVLVDLERYDEAMEHLVAVNGRGVAEYNMGYLLFKKGRGDLALRHFTAAAEHNPHMTQAQWWVARLNEREPGVSSPAQFAGTPGRATEPESVAPTRRPTYTASSERPQRAPMVWVESTDPAHGAPPNRNGVPGCERIPPLRQPENVVPVQRTPYGAFGGRPQEWAPSAPPTKRSLEPLPTIRR
jgi:hypothetical protein